MQHSVVRSAQDESLPARNSSSIQWLLLAVHSHPLNPTAPGTRGNYDWEALVVNYLLLKVFSGVSAIRADWIFGRLIYHRASFFKTLLHYLQQVFL